MARIRTLKPEFWADEKLAPLPPIDRLVFLGLISQADDAGRLVDNPRLLNGALFPETDDDCRQSLDTLARIGRILRYESASGQRLIQIANWKRHQRVDNPAKYTLPAPQSEVLTQPSVTESSREPSEDRATVSRSDLRPTTEDLRTPNNEHRPTTGDLPRARREGSTGDVDSLALVEETARRAFKNPDHVRSFVTAAGPIVKGTDTACWKNGRGKVVPLADQPRLLELALTHWEAKPEEERRVTSLRSCVRYIVAQQTDAFALPVALNPNSQAGRVTNEKPRESAARGDRPALVVSNGGVVDVDEEIRRVREWEKTATKAECDVLRTQARREIEEDESTANLRLALGEAAVRGRIDARYRELVLEQIARAA